MPAQMLHKLGGLETKEVIVWEDEEGLLVTPLPNKETAKEEASEPEAVETPETEEMPEEEEKPQETATDESPEGIDTTNETVEEETEADKEVRQEEEDESVPEPEKKEEEFGEVEEPDDGGVFQPASEVGHNHVVATADGELDTLVKID
jgi:hypothetical protein